MQGDPKIGEFEYDGTRLEAWIAGRYWHVRFDSREVQARSLGEALEEVMGNAKDHAERRRRDRLIVRVLIWSQGDSQLR